MTFHRYAWWSLSAVTAAFDRAKESNSRFLTRNEFWQIFTDYTVLTLKKKASAPTFLCLSLDVFNLFAVEMAGTGILEPIVPPPGSEEPPPPPPQPKPLPSPTNDRPSSAASQRSTSSRASASRPAMLRRQASKRAALQRSSSSRSLRRGASTRSLQASPSSEGGQSSKVPEAKHSEGGEGPATDEPAVDAPGGTGGNVASPENDERKASDSKSDAPATPPLAPAGVGKIGLLRKKLQRAGKRAAARALVAKTWVLPMPRVDVFEIVLVLALFCQGDVGAKLKWMFRVRGGACGVAGVFGLGCSRPDVVLRGTAWYRYLTRMPPAASPRTKCLSSSACCVLPASKSACSKTCPPTTCWKSSPPRCSRLPTMTTAAPSLPQSLRRGLRSTSWRKAVRTCPAPLLSTMRRHVSLHGCVGVVNHSPYRV